MIIAVLFHEKTRKRHVQTCVIPYLAEIWRRDGHKVVYLFGTERFIPADLCFVHVDLSVVPEEYIEFANRYPFVINGRITDVRKRNFSKIELKKPDRYQGPVIVKSDENFAGWPERLVKLPAPTVVFLKIWSTLGFSARRFLSPYDYRVYQDLRDVPDRFFQDNYFLVERFLPDFEDGIYYLNMYMFFGSYEFCYRIGSTEPVVKTYKVVSKVLVEPHPEVRKIRKRMNIDYGKIDYCMNDGKPVLLDVNKTIGYAGPGPLGEKQLESMLEDRARAAYEFASDSRNL